jgi:integrase
MGKRAKERLSALAVSRANKPGMYADGNGLYLRVAANGGRAWVLRYMLEGRAREMGLGPLAAVSLAEARKRALEARRLKSEGIDPIAAKVARRAAAAAERAKAVTFKAAAETYIDSHKAGWRNTKHAKQWTNTLTTYAFPVLGKLPVGEIDAGLVMKVLEPIWQKKTETASRVRMRLEAVLDWAIARGYRKGDNPARWKGHLENLLPKRGKVQQVKHHPALPYREVGAFVADLRNQDGFAALALELLILTASRTSEVLGASWDEIDLKATTWVIPAGRIKAGREHRVPLSAPAVAVLTKLKDARQTLPDGTLCPWVFPGVKGRHLSNGAILALLRRMKRNDITPHGFRSTFRDWAAEQTAFPREVAEMALAHTIGNKVEAAYRRGDLLEKRKRLMGAWASYCNTVPAEGAKVLPMRQSIAKLR